MFKIDSAIIRKAKGNPSNIKRLQSIIENQNTLDPIENYLDMTKTELNEINSLMKQRALAKNSNSDHQKPDSSSSHAINETNLNKTESSNQQPIVMRSKPDTEVKSSDLPTAQYAIAQVLKVNLKSPWGGLEIGLVQIHRLFPTQAQ